MTGSPWLASSRALADAESYIEGGMDGLIIEDAITTEAMWLRLGAARAAEEGGPEALPRQGRDRLDAYPQQSGEGGRN